jgi:hypothetical protein
LRHATESAQAVGPATLARRGKRAGHMYQTSSSTAKVSAALEKPQA